jgi:hypothetical protein
VSPGERLIDPTWDVAIDTQQAVGAATVREIVGPVVTNVLWRWLGVRAIPHVPCRFDCRPSIDLGTRLIQAGVDLGHGEETRWLQDILAWPVEWSALHGIAEIKTPILKLATRTDATANKLVVRWRGHGYPAEGAKGIVFPYLRSERLATKDTRERCCDDDQPLHLVQLQRRVEPIRQETRCRSQRGGDVEGHT